MLAACGGLSACATSTSPNTTASFAPTAAAVLMLPETVEEVPSSSPGSAEDGMRSLARDVEMNAQAQPAAYVTQQPASSVAAVEQLTGKTAIQTVSVPAGVKAEVAAAPTQPEDGNSVVETVVQAPVTVARATAGVIGAAAQALPNPFGKSTEEAGAPPLPPEGRLGPAGGVAARSPELDQLMRTYADYYGVPEELVRKVARRESTFNPTARNGRYLGLMQISHATARGMGYRGAPAGLLDAETNLKYAVRYLRGAYVVAKGNHGVADRLYQSGYYYHAKRAGLLDETGVGRDRLRRRRL